MKRKLFALFITLVLTFAFSVNCFALPSPTETILPTKPNQTITIKPVNDGNVTDGTWKKGNEDGITFVINVKVDENTKFYVDGKVLDASDYTLGDDGKSITLTADFLASLSVGEHTITVETSDGRTASSSFTVTEDGQVTVKPNDGSISPKTADNSNYLLLVSLLLISGSCLGAMVINKKKITR